MRTPDNGLTATGLHASWNDRPVLPVLPVLADVHLHASAEEPLAVVGPSGCGKSTLLTILCGLVRPPLTVQGSVALNGQPVTRPRTDIAIILQHYGLLPWKRVVDNVALPLKLAGVDRATRTARAEAELLAMGLGGRGGDYPSCLSGGQQQRVAIARAFAADPALLLLDEPFSSVDAITRERLQQALLARWREHPVPYVLVTHAVEEALVLARRVVVLSSEVPGSPATITRTFENPRFGDPDWLESDAFYERMREVRAALRPLGDVASGCVGGVA